MGVLDTHVWTSHWFRPFRLYILTSWAGAQVGVQDSHIHMQCVNIKDPKGWCTCGRPGRPCVDLSLVPTIPTLHIDMGQAIMGWCICRRPGLPYPYAGCEYQDPQGLVHMWVFWMPMCGPAIDSNHSDSCGGSIINWCICGHPVLPCQYVKLEYLESSMTSGGLKQIVCR